MTGPENLCGARVYFTGLLPSSSVLPRSSPRGARGGGPGGRGGPQGRGRAQGGREGRANEWTVAVLDPEHLVVARGQRPPRAPREPGPRVKEARGHVPHVEDQQF